MTERGARVHLAHPVNPYRTVCGQNILLVLFVVRASDSVTCGSCRRGIEQKGGSDGQA